MKSASEYEDRGSGSSQDFNMEESQSLQPTNVQKRNIYIYIGIFKAIAGATIIFLMVLTKSHSRTSKDVDSKELTILLWNAGGSLIENKYECGCMVTNRYNPKRTVDAVIINVNRPYTTLGLDRIKYGLNHLVVLAAPRPVNLTQKPLSASELAIFNYSMSYRLDSDLIWTPYYISPVANSQQRVQHFPAADLKFPQRLKFKLEALLEAKYLLAAYKLYEVNADTMAQSRYLEELRKHTEVDAFISCSTNFCSFYKFMLIFESNSCPDYVNPQFHVALANYMVPVLIGGGNVSQLVPPGSYIRGEDFSSPKQLVQHLRNISTNLELYEQFFRWHTKYQLHSINRPYCALCRQLRQPRRALQAGRLVNWWHEYKCNNESNRLDTTLKPHSAANTHTLTQL